MMLPSLPDVVRLHPLVTRILGQNPGPTTLQGTNSYLVGRADKPRILIDTTSKGAGLQTYLDLLEAECKVMRSEFNDPIKSPISSIVLTHWHPDHVGGVEAVQALLQRIAPSSSPVPVYKRLAGPSLQELGFCQDKVLPMAEQYCISNEAVLRTVITPGHAEDHVCLSLVIEGAVEFVFTGDLILGHGTTIVSDLVAYMESLQRIRKVVLSEEEISTTPFPIPFHTALLCPGHGQIVKESVGKIDEYILHRRTRIKMTAETFQTLTPAFKWMKEDILLDHVYPGINPLLRRAALNNLRQSLLWLQIHPAATVHDKAMTVIVIGPRKINQSHMLLNTADLFRDPLNEDNESVLSEDWEWMWHPSSDV